APGSTPEGRRKRAGELDRAAGCAWRAGDLDRAARLLADADALDPNREDLWRQRREQLVATAARQGQSLDDQLRQRRWAAGIRDDDPALARIREWSATVFAREAGQ